MNIAVPPPLPPAYAIVDTAEIVQSADTVGFADSQLYGETPAEINANLDLLQSTGSNTVRIDIPWAGVEPLQGAYDWSETDAIVQAAESRGMAIDADINSTPYWAATSGTPPISGPRRRTPPMPPSPRRSPPGTSDRSRPTRSGTSPTARSSGRRAPTPPRTPHS